MIEQGEKIGVKPIDFFLAFSKERRMADLAGKQLLIPDLYYRWIIKYLKRQF
jgi:hypothetical protein